jgi:hypothetical protein
MRILGEKSLISSAASVLWFVLVKYFFIESLALGYSISLRCGTLPNSGILRVSTEPEPCFIGIKVQTGSYVSSA